MLSWSLPVDFEYPQWLWLCLIVPVLAFISLRSLTGLEKSRRIVVLTVRCVLIILIAFCLAGIERVRRNDDLTVLFLMDRSHSVEKLVDKQDEFIREVTKKVRPTDRVGMIDFARQAFLQQLPMHGGYFLPPGRLPTMPNTDRTDIGSAMRLAMAMFPHDSAKRIVLMSDGNDNMGDVLAEARRAKADGIPIDVLPLWYEHRNEVYFDRMIAPTHAEPGEQLPLRMVLQTTKPVSGKIDLYQNGALVDIPEDQRRVRLKPGGNTFYMKLPVNTASTQSFEAIFQPDDESMDGVSLNNRSRAFTFVSGASRVLIISNNIEHDRVLYDALRSENVQADIRSTDQLGTFELADMMSYSTILLANVPAAAFTDDQQKALSVYVKDLGSGLLMLGGDESFGAGGWIGSPIEEIMPVSFEIKHKRVIPRGALALIMHSCEIPRGNFWAKEMAKKSLDTISSQDYFGVLAYTYSPPGENWEVPLDVATNKAAIKSRIDRMQVGDMPDFGSTMEMAYNELMTGRGRDAAQRHVIMFSDGDAQPPSNALLDKYVQSKITVSTIGIGWGAHVMDKSLRDIAAKTGGQFYAPRNSEALPQIFSKESKVVRRPLIIDQPFTPKLVQLHSDLTGGVDMAGMLPQLGGMVLTSARPHPNALVTLVRATDDGEDPVLAHWQYELGKTVAFTSGFWPYWGEHWTSWSGYAKFWAQVVRWTMRQDTPANFDTYTRVEGDKAKVVIDALDKDAGYLNNLVQRGRIIGPDNREVAANFRQTGPGKYEAEFEVDRAGQYLANIQVFDGAKSLGAIRTGVTVPFSPEYRDLKPSEATLRQIAEITGGRWLDGGTKNADVFSHDLPPSEAKRAAWDWVLAWLVLPAFLLDVAVRRLASTLALSIALELVILSVLLFGLDIRNGTWWGIVGAVLFAELVGWTIRHAYFWSIWEYLFGGATALATSGERSASALGRLKTTRERVRTEQDEKNTESADQQSLSSRRARHFEVEEGTVPLSGLEESLGGATSRDAEKSKPKALDAGKGDDDQDATSRLLRAKRRAQREMKKDDE